MRELVFIAANKFEFKAQHLEGKKNILPDLLSRWGQGSRIHHKFRVLTENKGCTEKDIPHNVFNLLHTW